MKLGLEQFTSQVAPLLSRKAALSYICDQSLLVGRHAHIYGIDLASPSELIAHNREPDIIAKHIGADSVVFQSLDDLIGACASLSSYTNPKAKVKEPSQFEVGVFCGTYITPVGVGYFEHLEKVRGEGRKLKAVEGAREAVLSGVAGKEEIEMAINGVKVDGNGKVIPAEDPDDSATPHVNGYDSKRPSLASLSDAESPTVRDTMDISLHNFGDYNQD